MYEKMKLIKDERTREAIKEGYMGMDGKLGCILRHLGQPIISSDGGLDEDVYNDDDNPNQLPMFDSEGYTNEMGWYFSGLSRGMHLEIKYISDKYELMVIWRGISVYVEISGELLKYTPDKEWQHCISRLYVVAKKIEEKDRRENKEIAKQEVQEQKLSFLKTLKNLWGI